MVRSYVSIALRHFVTQRLYSAINILGLAIGLACFIVIAVFVRHELGYDRHFANAERIYRISRDFTDTRLATNAAPVQQLLKEDFAEIEHAARISLSGAVLGLGEGSVVNEPGLRYADNELFEIFGFDWLRGDPATALAEPATVVLTSSAARRYFADEDPLGQTLLLENRLPIRVTGVIEDLGRSTHLQFSMLVSMPTIATIRGPRILESWGFNQYYTYVLLKPGAKIDAIRSGSDDFFERHYERGSSANTGFSATLLTDIHLSSNRSTEMQPPGSSTMVYTFSAIALFVLLIACVNFVNLATARSAQRAKEIGVRKSVGADRRQLVVQFLCESVVLSLIAVVLAVAVVDVVLPRVNSFLGVELELDYFGEPAVFAALGLLALCTGVAAGAYPAFYLSAFDPARVLKGDVTRGRAAAGFRKVLVVLQFAVSIALLIATSVVYLQLQFSRNIDLGYEKDQIVVVNGSFSAGLGDQWQALKREWSAHPEITHVTASIVAPTTDNDLGIGIRAEGGDPEGAGLPFMWVDYEFFETYDIGVVAGRTFSEDFANDRMAAQARAGSGGAYILNERGARQFGWTPAEAVGKWLELTPGQNRGPVIGVVEDVHYESVRTEITPMVYMVPPAGEQLGYHPLMVASLRITGRNLQSTLEHIDATWRAFLPEQPIDRRFLDEDFDRLYLAEERQGKMVTTFAALAIFIACLGLFGLASFAAQRRTKEIGVRKALGGGVLDIVRLFTGEFTKLVLIASLIAWPVAYLLMRTWLESFAYRIGMSPFIFAGATAAALAVAWLTVATVAARAATAKPLHALRYE